MNDSYLPWEIYPNIYDVDEKSKDKSEKIRQKRQRQTGWMIWTCHWKNSDPNVCNVDVQENGLASSPPQPTRAETMRYVVVEICVKRWDTGSVTWKTNLMFRKMALLLCRPRPPELKQWDSCGNYSERIRYLNCHMEKMYVQKNKFLCRPRPPELEQ